DLRVTRAWTIIPKRIGKINRANCRVRPDAGAQPDLARSLGPCRGHFARGIARVATPVAPGDGIRADCAKKRDPRGSLLKQLGLRTPRLNFKRETRHRCQR